MTTTFQVITAPDGISNLYVIIENGDGSFTSMSKETYDANRTDTPTQVELDAIAKAKADAQADQAARDSADALAAKVRSDAIQRFLSLGFTQLEAEAMFP
jgi:hypothetical protein